MAYLVMLTKDHRAHLLESAEDVCRACLTYINPSSVVEDWLKTAAPTDVLQDSRFGRIVVVALGTVTDAAELAARAEAKQNLADATDSVSAAINALRGARS